MLESTSIRNTCCCRYHVEFEYYYKTFLHIRQFLHPNHVQECSSITPPILSRDFLHTIMCRRRDMHAYYAKQCLDGTCNICGANHYGVSASMRMRIIHSQIQLLKRKNFTWEIYQLHDGKQSRKIKLLNLQVTMSSSQLNQHVLF